MTEEADKPVTTCDGSDGNGFNYDFQAFYTQVICTFLFVSVILMVKGMGGPAMTPTSDGMLGPTTVALSLAGLIQVATRLGPVFNPAVAIAFIVLDVWQTENPNKIYSHYTYAYTLGPALGGILAGFFHLLHAKAFAEKKEPLHTYEDPDDAGRKEHLLAPNGNAY